MSTYGGFDPGTFQPWALNLEQKSLGTQGIAHGMQVVAESPAAMQVTVNTDPTQGDGVCFLTNGGWVRIDDVVNLSVPSNSSGAQRTDAVIALLDPTGDTASAVYYTTDWAGGFKGTDNQCVLALVQVPNGASSIVTSNIVQTPLQANVGTTAPIISDAVAAQNAPDTQHPGVFTQYNVVLSASATNGQTSFSVPLTTLQRLVPTGYIGGAKELGFLAGKGGMYVPQLFGSTSGPLPVASVDHINGTITSSVGAQSGEQVTASFRYYDFGRDLNVWAGEMLLEANSPYIVYQGDILPGTLHKTGDVWDTSTPGFLPETLPLTTIYTFYGKSIRFSAGLPNGSKSLLSVSLDGGSSSNWVANGSYTYGPHSEHYTLAGSSIGIHAATLQVLGGPSELGGPRVSVDASNATLYVDGGIAVVNGNTVFVSNTSVALNDTGIGTVYVDRYGNVSTAFSVLGKAEQYAGSVPILPSTQYGASVNTSTAYGLYGHVVNPYHYPAYVTAGRYGISTLPGSTLSHELAVVGDPASPYGGYLISSTASDAVSVQAVCTGADLITLGTVNASVLVSIDNVTSYGLVIPAATSGSPRVRTVMATSLPYGSHALVFDVTTTNTSLGFEAVDLRMPAWPTTPAGTLPLASFWVPGPNAYMKHSLMRGVDLTEISAGHVQTINDVQHYAPGPAPVFTNVNSGNAIVQTINTSGAFRLSYTAFPAGGKFTLRLDSVSTLATLDTYNSTYTMSTTPWYTVSNGLHTIGVYTTSTKNASSTGYGVIPTAIEHIALPVALFDRRRFPSDGRSPSFQGSGLLSAHGAALPDAGYGIRTEHLQDRAVTSRKMMPTWARTISTTQWSGAPGTDPYTTTTITVEAPSLLFINSVSFPNIISSGNWATAQIQVDGVGAEGASGIVRNVGSLDTTLTLNLTDMVPVGPGTHTISVTYGANGGKNPYLPDNIQRVLSVVAFAL